MTTGNNGIVRENSLSRIWKHATEHDSGTIAACRNMKDCGDGEEITEDTNKRRNSRLKMKLLAMGYGVTRVEGTYMEHYGTPGEQKVKEQAFIVIDLQDKGTLRDDLIKLGQYFDQDSITYSKPSGEYYLISTNTCPKAYPGRGKVGVSIKLEKPFFGKKGEFYSSINGRPFVFGEVCPRIDTIRCYSIPEIRSIIQVDKEIRI